MIAVIFFSLLDFYNWNRVKVRYCDGGSFTGDGSDAVSEILSQLETFCFLIKCGRHGMQLQKTIFGLFCLLNHNNSMSDFLLFL